MTIYELRNVDGVHRRRFDTLDRAIEFLESDDAWSWKVFEIQERELGPKDMPWNKP